MNKKSPRKKFHKEPYSELILETNILDEKFSKLLGKYFVCEKISKKLIGSDNKSDKSLHLGSLKSALREYSIKIPENILNTIFASKLDNKNEKSFRVIRDKVCHSCSIKYRDFGNRYFDKYDEMMENFLNSLKELVCF